MPKYLFRANYTSEGAKGLVKDGGSKRRSVLQKSCESLGGRLESFYFAFGDTDAYVTVDLPDAASAAAMALTVAAGGAAGVHTTVLLTPEELDAAARKSPMYTPPGQ